MTDLTNVAARIAGHLLRFAADPKSNAPHPEKGGMRYYDQPTAYSVGDVVHVTYHATRGYRVLTEAEAMAYLAWLDAGNVGRHYEQQQSGGRT